MAEKEWERAFSPGDVVEHEDGSIYIAARFRSGRWCMKVVLETSEYKPSKSNEWQWGANDSPLRKVGHVEL